jgi:hypothetical protein
VQRGESAEAREGGGQLVTDADAHARRRRRGVAHDVAKATHRFTDSAEAGLVGVGAGLAIARDADHDELRVDLRKLLEATAPFLHGARAEILKYKVSIFD